MPYTERFTSNCLQDSMHWICSVILVCCTCVLHNPIHVLFAAMMLCMHMMFRKLNHSSMVLHPTHASCLCSM